MVEFIQKKIFNFKKKYMACIQKLAGLLPRLKQFEKEHQQTTGGGGVGNEFDSDDEF
jgi:hypothetical protein